MTREESRESTVGYLRYAATWPDNAPPLTETNSARCANTIFLTPSLPAQYIFAIRFL